MVRTTFRFTESDSKEQVILRHRKKIKVFREYRKDHLHWMDKDNIPITHRNYIVVEIPHTYKVNWSKWNDKHDSNIAVGFERIEEEHKTILRFYDHLPFTWVVKNLERIGVAKVAIRFIPNKSEVGEKYPLFIEPSGFYQWSYDLIFSLIQLPSVLRKEKIEKQLKEEK